jgi:hypothetical protein
MQAEKALLQNDGDVGRTICALITPRSINIFNNPLNSYPYIIKALKLPLLQSDVLLEIPQEVVHSPFRAYFDQILNVSPPYQPQPLL